MNFFFLFKTMIMIFSFGFLVWWCLRVCRWMCFFYIQIAQLFNDCFFSKQKKNSNLERIKHKLLEKKSLWNHFFLKEKKIHFQNDCRLCLCVTFHHSVSQSVSRIVKKKILNIIDSWKWEMKKKWKFFTRWMNEWINEEKKT